DPYETVVARWSSFVAARSSPPSSPIRQILPAPPGLPRRPAVLVLPGQPIPIGRPYRTQPDGVLKMLTARKSYAISDYPDDSSTTTSARPSCKRCRSPTSSVPAVSPVRGALSPVRADLSPPPKRIRDSNSVTNLEISSEDGYESYVPREILMSVLRMLMLLELKGWMIEMWLRLPPRRRLGLERDTVEVESRVGPVIEDDAHESVREDVLDHVTADGVVEVTYETLGVLVQRFHDHAVEIPVHRIQVIKSVQIFQGHEIVGVDLEVTTMTKRISALERDNTRLRSMLDVESQRVDRFQRGLSRD
ncbi:hypothetical protein Tco_0608803, partial [Tanacetum coccineum]